MSMVGLSEARPRPSHGASRSCVGCGARVARKRAARELVRLVLVPAERGELEVVVDLAGRGAGRGAWVHPHPLCLERAVARGLDRSARATVRADVSQLRRQIGAAAARRVEGLLGAAWRARRMVAGATAVRDAIERGTVALCVVAGDAAAAATSGAARAAQRDGKAIVFGDKRSLGAIVGRAEAGVLGITDPGMAVAVRQAAALACSLAFG